MARSADKSMSPFDVVLVSNRATSDPSVREFVFDVRANRQVQRYTIKASGYEAATDSLAWAVQANVRSAGDFAIERPGVRYVERDSSRVSGGVIATIAVATIAAQWIAGGVLRWLASRKEE